MMTKCVRAGYEMTKQQWFALPLDVRQRYWKETDWGNRPCSLELATLIAELLGEEPPL